MIAALGKIALLWWAATGDDFDVTGAGLGSTPFDANQLPQAVQDRLCELADEASATLKKNLIYTKYAGKWMGNYDVKRAREITDIADLIMLREAGLEHLWEDIELASAEFMKMTGERPGTVREVPEFV